MSFFLISFISVLISHLLACFIPLHLIPSPAFSVLGSIDLLLHFQLGASMFVCYLGICKTMPHPIHVAHASWCCANFSQHSDLTREDFAALVEGDALSAQLDVTSASTGGFSNCFCRQCLLTELPSLVSMFSPVIPFLDAPFLNPTLSAHAMYSLEANIALLSVVVIVALPHSQWLNSGPWAWIDHSSINTCTSSFSGFVDSW